jgi:hypothetical protein
MLVSSIAIDGPKRPAAMPVAERKRRSRGETLSNDRNFLREYEKILRENRGELPERITLKRQGHGDWLNELYRRKIGLNQLRKIIGQAPSRYDREESRMKIENLVVALRKMMETEGLLLLPDTKWGGWKRKYGPERDAVSVNGGIHKLREITGPLMLGAPAVEYYKDWKNAKAALLSIIEKKYWLPPIEQMLHNHRNILLIQSIYAFHGNLWEVRMRLETEGLAPATYVHSESKGKPLSDPGVIREIARKLAEKNGGIVPGAKNLKKMGLFHLASPITVNGGCRELTRKIQDGSTENI